MRCLIVSSLVVAILVSHQSHVSAEEVQDRVAIAMKSLAQQFIPILESENVEVVGLGGFNGPATTSGGPEIQLKLGLAFAAEGFTRNDINNDAQIRGGYEETHVRDEFGHLRLAVRVTAYAFNRSGRTLAQGNETFVVFQGNEAVPRLLGISTNVAHNTSDPDLTATWLEHQETPPSVIAGGVIWADASQTYGLEILIEDPEGATPRGTHRHPEYDDLAFVPIEPAEVYQVRLFNNADHEVCVLLTIDGIDSMAFYELNEEGNRPRYWIVPPHGSTIVHGWKVSDTHTEEFKVTNVFEETAAAELKYEPNPNMGDICAQFSACWEVGSQPPIDESGGSRGTSRGERIEDIIVVVPREIGNVRATVHVRYER